GDKDKNQPFCPACYAMGKVIPLQKAWDGRDKTQSPWKCPDCKNHYNPWDYKEPPHRPQFHDVGLGFQ
ncbi:MAG TPA: hypothetical protein VFK97_02860, partial [Candidatus Saccharimonadales bacterium]|nr:hypothetical protein [Candidatus Saccharimonadales bacterium]